MRCCPKEVEYTLDSAPPLLPEDFIAATDNGIVLLSWSSSISKNCIGYNIYRSDSENGEYKYLFTVTGSSTEMYQDRSVKFGETYFYKIESISSYDINSEMSEYASVTVDEDKMPPIISCILPAESRINKITKITAEAHDNISVEKIHFYYQEKDSKEWINLGEKDVESGKASFNFDTTSLADGEYTVKAIAQDENKNKSDAAVKDFTVDNTGISKIIIDEENCTANSSFVSIRWQDAVESDFGWFAVEKKIGENDFKEVGTTSQITGMHVEGLKPDTAYTFRVVGYDNLGNIGEYSDEITLTTTSDAIKPGISVFRPSSSSFSDKINISVTGADNIGIDSLKLRYSYDSSEEKTWTDLKEITAEKKNASETFTYIFDVSEMPEGEVYVEAEVTDTSGNSGEVCINKFRIDRAAPNAITDLNADGGSGSVHLTWTVSDNDIKSFEIYRCDGDKSEFSKIADCLTKDYYDSNVTFGTFYTYKIVAVDTAGNKSKESNCAITQSEEDIAAPKVHGFNYTSGTVLPSDPKIEVVASDNFKLDHVEISYKKADDPNNIWHDIKSLKMDSSYQSKEFDWKTDGFEEDKYILKAVAYDVSGLSSDPFTAEFTFDFTAPKKPVIELTQGNWKLNLNWSKNTEKDFDFYRVYRKANSEEKYSCIGDTRENEYVDNDVTPDKTYVYKIAAYDKTGNSSEGLSANIRPGDVDEIKPQISVDEQLYGVAGYEITFDGSDCTDNVRITNFTWELGNGDTIYGIRNTYIYKEAGTYEAKLTVEDAAENSNSTKISVVIHEKSNYGNVQVEVVDSSGKPLKSAYVYLYSGDDSNNKSFRTDSNGIVNAALPLGNQKIAAYKDGYLPESADVFVSSTMDNEKLKITLQSGELVTGILEVHRMSLAEMIEAGIDFNNPANYHSYTFTIELTFAQEPIPTYIEYHYVGGGGGYGGGFGGGGYGGGGFIGSSSSGSVKLSDGSNVQIKPIIYQTEETEEDIPILAYVRTTEIISFMKDIYAVDLGVINNANSPEFVIKNCTAKLNLPDGLSLAATTKKQTLTQSMDDIAGGQKKTVSWAIKGDKKGQYSLDADFSGTLMPFSAPVRANFTTETPFTVGAGDGINIYVYPESAAYIGKDYYIQFAVKNESSDTFYNLRTSFGAYTNPGYDQDITVIYPDGSSEKFVDKGACYQISEANECKSIPVITNGQSIRVGIFEPGDVVYGTYKTTFSAPGNSEEVYYKLIDSVVKEWTDTTNVKVHISPIPSHVTKYNVKHEIVADTWADPVDMTMGGFIDSITPIAVMGESELPFTLNYNSINSEFKGNLGYGWSHDYETYLDIDGNYINVHWNPTNYATFISENSVIRKVDGTIVNGEIAVEESDDTGYKNYIPISTETDEFKLYRDDDGTYTLTAPGGAKNVFDETGKLIKTINPNGKTVTFEHSENSVTITETITGTKLILNYNNSGLITSVSDENGRKAVIAYENELVSRITNVMGESVCYSYDENNRLISATVEGEERPYVINKYDEYGRVIEQDDGNESTPLTYFYYEGEEGGSLTVTATDRNNIHDAETNKNSHQVTFVSDSLGHVTSYTDQNGNVTRYSYDKNGNLTTETDAHGNKTSYTYDDHNWVTSVKDPSGYVTKMTYDKNGNITSVTGPNGEKNTYTYNLDNLLETISENSGAKKSYVYNDNAQVVSETIEGLGTKFYKYTNGRLTSVTDFLGNEILTEYDANGNISSVTDRDGNKTAYKYDNLNRIISETTSDGTISYTYDGRGNKTSVTDRRGDTVNYTYDGNNLITQLETAKGITKFAYDNEGRLTSQTAPDDTILSNVYDAAGHVVKSVNGEGEISEYTYDAVGNVKTITAVNGDEKCIQTNEYYPNGKLKKTTFADGTTQSYEYDKSWRITKITDGLGNSTITEYDLNGNVIRVTDAEGNKTEYTYDIYGRILTVKDANGNITACDGYDANGNCLQITLPSGQVITFSYNNEGLPIQVTTNHNGENVSIFYEYDAAGRVNKYTDEEGNEFITEYDEAGNVTKLFDAYGNAVQSNSYDELNNLVSTTDTLGIETQYNYDSVGNLIKKIENLNSAREAESGYSYDKAGRLTSVVDAENGTSSYEYDQVGRITAQIDPNGGRSEYSYDSMGRIIESVTALGSQNKYAYNAVGLLKEAENARGQKTSYTYYKNGWIKSFTDEIGTVSYTYDGNGNVLTVTDENGTITREYNEMNLVTKYTDFRGNTIDYSYDQLGNLVTLTYPGGKIVRYSYYKNGNIETVTDWDENITSYEYNGNGRLTKTTRPDGSVETRTYDKAGRLISQSDVNGEVVICQRDYAYDESGNITNIDTTNAMGVTGLNSAEMVYNENNQLVKYNDETVKYDAGGNMIYGPLNGKMADFKYDCRNRLVSAGGTTYAYDAENNRISKTVDKIKTEYVIDSTGSLTRILTASTDSKTTYFVYGIGLISQEYDNEVLFYHFNNIGSTEAVTSLDGKIQEKFEYGPYGELLSENKCGTIFLYNGEYGVSTDENGLYYMRARYYNPEIKRFINQDVVIGSIVDSPSLNRYAYVEGNPISLADPFGLSPAINWGRAGHTILNILGLFTFVPGLNWIGIAANAINAVWYFAEGNIFNRICSSLAALPGIGGIVGKIGSASRFSNAALMIQKGTQIASNVGFIATGAYTIGKMGYDNYQKYVVRGEDFSFWDFAGDAVNGAFAVLSIYGGAKGLGLDKVVIDSNGNSLPQGISQEQFDKASEIIRDKVGNISDDIVVQGSRANGTAKPTSDIDIAIRVDSKKFNDLINNYFKTPNPGSAKERTMLHAIESGKIQAGEAKLSGLRKQLEIVFGVDVDISIIEIGGSFDNPPFISFE